MNPSPPNRPPAGPDDDLGQPIEELEALVEEPSPSFLARVRRRVERKILTSQFLDLSWFAPVFVFLEFLDVIFRGLSRKQ